MALVAHRGMEVAAQHIVDTLPESSVRRIMSMLQLSPIKLSETIAVGVGSWRNAQWYQTFFEQVSKKFTGVSDYIDWVFMLFGWNSRRKVHPGFQDLFDDFQQAQGAEARADLLANSTRYLPYLAAAIAAYYPNQTLQFVSFLGSKLRERAFSPRARPAPANARAAPAQHQPQYRPSASPIRQNASSERARVSSARQSGPSSPSIRQTVPVAPPEPHRSRSRSMSGEKPKKQTRARTRAPSTKRTRAQPAAATNASPRRLRTRTNINYKI